MKAKKTSPPSLTSSRRGCEGWPSRCHGGPAAEEEDRLEEPCLLVQEGVRQHPYPQEDSSHGPWSHPFGSAPRASWTSARGAGPRARPATAQRGSGRPALSGAP